MSFIHCSTRDTVSFCCSSLLPEPTEAARLLLEETLRRESPPPRKLVVGMATGGNCALFETRFVGPLLATLGTLVGPACGPVNVKTVANSPLTVGWLVLSKITVN